MCGIEKLSAGISDGVGCLGRIVRYKSTSACTGRKSFLVPKRAVCILSNTERSFCALLGVFKDLQNKNVCPVSVMIF
jgi:hypothetical protein